MVRSSILCLALFAAACGDPDKCLPEVACGNRGATYHTCTSADGTRCRVDTSDGLSLACSSCSDCAAAVQLATASCGGATTTTTMQSTNCSNLPKTQGPSQPCCPGWGVDACGANLFCAAFDGRTQATCYLANSRLDGQECNSDDQCASRSCNATARKCRALPSMPCTPEVGCSSALSGRYVCIDGSCDSSSGQSGSACGANADCLNGLVCALGKCADGSSGGAAGDPCTAGDQCLAGVCATCASTHYVSCRTVTGGNSGTCLAGDGLSGSVCTYPPRCASGLKCIDNSYLGSAFVGGVSYQAGQCSAGLEWDTCTSASDCVGGRACIVSVNSGHMIGVCGTGESGGPCSLDQDCLSGSCRYSGLREPFGTCL